MYKRILAPFDLSGYSECTLGHLTAIAKGMKVPEVILLSVVEPFQHQVYEVPEDFVKQGKERALNQTEEYLAELAGRLQKEKINTSTVILQGRAADEILNYAKNNNVDFIIISTHGRSGVSRWAMGSVADKIVRQSPVPVLTVTPAECIISRQGS